MLIRTSRFERFALTVVTAAGMVWLVRQLPAPARNVALVLVMFLVGTVVVLVIGFWRVIVGALVLAALALLARRLAV